MRCVDVNVLVDAHRIEAPDHDRWRTWLDDARRGDEKLGLINVALSGFLRIVTHPRIFKEPSPMSIALDFVDSLRASPAAMPVDPGPACWEKFRELCRDGGVRGNVVPDAFLAAAAIEAAATLVTADRGFARFPGLRLDHPV